jgi:hypothetical protein
MSVLFTSDALLAGPYARSRRIPDNGLIEATSDGIDDPDIADHPWALHH